MTLQAALELDPPLSKVERAYRAWRETDDGRTIYQEAVERASRLKLMGFKHFSIDAIWHAMRFDHAVKVGPDEYGYKLNDHHTAYMAREIMEKNPGLAGFFELRTLRGRHF